VLDQAIFVNLVHASVRGQWLGGVAQWSMNLFFKKKTLPRSAWVMTDGLTGDQQRATLLAGDFFGA
jgi:hypothetical protein